MNEPRRKWNTANREHAQVEALRAIAEELELLRDLLERVVKGRILVVSREEADEPAAKSCG